MLLILDASGGQNAVIQAEQFNKAVLVNGMVLTKLDGTAKGGMVLNAIKRIQAPVIWIGTGEKVTDLMPFNNEDFAKALVYDDSSSKS